jgi:hypothetical protein
MSSNKINRDTIRERLLSCYEFLQYTGNVHGKYESEIDFLEHALFDVEVIEDSEHRSDQQVGGEEVIAMSSGAMPYKYRFICRGIEFLIHSNPPKESINMKRYLFIFLILFSSPLQGGAIDTTNILEMVFRAVW